MEASIVETRLKPYWEAALGARRGPNRQHWIEVINEQCLMEDDAMLHKLYLKLEEELHNVKRDEDAA